MDSLLEVHDLKTHLMTSQGVVKAVDGVSYDVRAAETVALVGESGCGKTMSALSIMRLLPKPQGRIVGGRIRFDGRELLDLSEKEMREVRGRDIAMIFQEPMTSLNPVLTVERQLTETLEAHGGERKQELRDRALELLRLVRIPDPERRLESYPHQLSGGMRQRVMIAIALSCQPKLILADEPTTALDVTIQAQILDLMNKLKNETGASILFITHDMGVIAEMAQNVAVMYAGKVMEYADVKSLYANPKNPYTIGLLQSIPVLGRETKDKRLKTISGVVPSLLNLPTGCLYNDRCPDVFNDCHQVEPEMYPVAENHFVRCLKYA